MMLDYEVGQELSRNAWFRLSCGRSRKDGRSVLLKTPSREPESRFEIELLAREYTLLQRLALPGVPRALEFQHYDRGACLVLEDHGGMLLPMLLAARRLDLEAFFKLAIPLTTILGELHRQEIIHNNINPSGILVHPASPRAVTYALPI